MPLPVDAIMSALVSVTLAPTLIRWPRFCQPHACPVTLCHTVLTNVMLGCQHLPYLLTAIFPDLPWHEDVKIIIHDYGLTESCRLVKKIWKELTASYTEAMWKLFVPFIILCFFKGILSFGQPHRLRSKENRREEECREQRRILRREAEEERWR